MLLGNKYPVFIYSALSFIFLQSVLLCIMCTLFLMYLVLFVVMTFYFKLAYVCC